MAMSAGLMLRVGRASSGSLINPITSGDVSLLRFLQHWTIHWFMTVTLHRDSIAESRHRVHAVVCDGRGRVLMAAGDPGHETFIRSALKPFQALPFISSGAAAQMDVGDRGLAIQFGLPLGARSMPGSLQTALERRPRRQPPAVSGSVLGRQPAPAQLLDNTPPFLRACRKIGWPLESYLQQDHPLQQEIQRRVAELLGLPAQELVAAGDDCGAPTLRLQLAQMAAVCPPRCVTARGTGTALPRDVVHPDLVAGEGRFDTELMSRSHGQVLSKGAPKACNA